MTKTQIPRSTTVEGDIEAIPQIPNRTATKTDIMAKHIPNRSTIKCYVMTES